MKRLILLLPLLYAASAWATGNTVATHCTPAAATSCTLSATPSFGNLMVSMAYRSNSATAPTTSSGWTVIQSTTGSVNSLKTAWKYSLGNETTCGTWTNATQTSCEVYSGNWINAGTLGGPIGDNTSGTTGASGALSYPTFTLVNPLSTSWVACAGGALSGTADSAPTGMTSRSGTSITNIFYGDTNGNVSTWSTQTTDNPGVNWATACFEIIGSPAMSDPTTSHLVHSIYYNVSREATTTPFTLTLPVPSSLSGNFLKVVFGWGYATTARTVSNIYCNSDTGHATWTWSLEKSVLDTGDTTDMFVYSIQGATAGCTSVSVVASGAWNTAFAWYREMYGIAISGAVESAVGQVVTGTAPYLSSGTVSPTSTGDIIEMDCTAATIGSGVATGPSAGQVTFTSGGTVLLSPSDWYDALISTYFTETGSAALTPNLMMVGWTGNGACIADAIKVDVTKGTAPSGVYILAMGNESVGNATTNYLQHHNLVAGNALLLVSNGNQGSDVVQWTGITDFANLTSFTSYQPHDANGGYPNWALDCNTLAGDTIITLTGTSTASTTGNYNWAEIAGLDHSSHTACYDSTAGTPTAFTGSGSSSTNMPSITPSTSGGIIAASTEMGTGSFPMSVNAPSGANFAVAIYDGQTDASGMQLGNMFGWVLNSSTSAKNWGWTNDSTSTSWNAVAIALKAAAAGGTAVSGKAVIF